MSIRKEHLEAFDNAFSSLNNAVELGKEIAMNKEDLTQKISQAAEQGLGAIQGVAQGYQAYKTLKAVNSAKKAANAAKNAANKAKKTNTGNKEAPEANQDTQQTTQNTDSTTERPTENPQGEASNPAETTTGGEQAENAAEAAGGEGEAPTVEAGEEAAQTLTETAAPTTTTTDLYSMREIINDPELYKNYASQKFGDITGAEGFGDAEIEESRQQLMQMENIDLDKLEFVDRPVSQAVENTPAEAMDQLYPMRQMMGQQGGDAERAANAAEAGADATPETTTAAGGAEAAADAGADVGGGLAEAATTATTGLTEGAAATISGVSDALDLATAATIEVPILGEIVGVFAGLGSVIAAAFSGAESKKPAPTPVINQVGGDFSNNDEHGGVNMAAY